MGLPSITSSFKEKGITAIKRSQRGIVAMILKEENIETLKSMYTIYTTTDIPEGISDFNKEQIELALMGYQTAPKKVLILLQKSDVENYTDSLKVLENTRFDYLVIPAITDKETTTISTWVKGMRTTKDLKIKAVLPNESADNEGVINFTNTIIKTKAKEYTTAQYCSRIAGLIAGTPMTISCTFAPLPEVIQCDLYTKEEYDTKVDAGEFFMFNDGEKIKVARGVNSFVTTIQDKGQSFRKVKLVDAMDMIHDDIKKTAQDSYIGKYANSYDNKMLLISAIKGYFDQLELDGILDKGKNSVGIDVLQQRTWLLSNGLFTNDELAEMTEQEIKEANTKDQVFLSASIKILDAIEEIKLDIQI